MTSVAFIVLEHSLEMAVYESDGIERQAFLLQPRLERVHRARTFDEVLEVVLLGSSKPLEDRGILYEIIVCFIRKFL